MAEEKNVIQETDGEAIRLARTLMRAARYGALAVLDPESGAPVASRVAVATAVDGTPIILVSGLSSHTAAIQVDPRCSLLLGEPGSGDPLAYPRISLFCRAAKLERGTAAAGEAERRYLNRHPKARLYAGFRDFAFFRLEVEGAGLNGGFARAYRLGCADLIVDGPAVAAIEAGEQSALDHMNTDHRDAVQRYARQAGAADGESWRLAGVDPEGIDLVRGDRTQRLFFAVPVEDMDGLRNALVDLARAAGPSE
jgi:putative heme iron utilization protein